MSHSREKSKKRSSSNQEDKGSASTRSVSESKDSTMTKSQKTNKPKRKSSWKSGSYLLPKKKRKTNISTSTAGSRTNESIKKVSKSSKPRTTNTDSKVTRKRIKVEPDSSDDYERVIKVEPQMVENPFALLFEQTAESIMEESEMEAGNTIVTRKKSSNRKNYLKRHSTCVEEDDSAIESEDPLSWNEEYLDLDEDESSQNKSEYTNYSMLQPSQVENLIFIESLFNTYGCTYSEMNNYGGSIEFIAPETIKSEDLLNSNNQSSTEKQLETNNNVDFNDSTNPTSTNKSDKTKNASPVEDNDDSTTCNVVDNRLLHKNVSQEHINCQIVPQTTVVDPLSSMSENNDNSTVKNEGIFSEQILADNSSISCSKEQTKIHEVIDLTRSHSVETKMKGSTRSKPPIIIKSDKKCKPNFINLSPLKYNQNIIFPKSKAAPKSIPNNGGKEEVMKKSLKRSQHPYSFHGTNKLHISSEKSAPKNHVQINDGGISKKKGSTMGKNPDLLKLVRNNYPELSIDVLKKPMAKLSPKVIRQPSLKVIPEPVRKVIKMPLQKLIQKPLPEPAQEALPDYRQEYSPESTQDSTPQFLHENPPEFIKDSPLKLKHKPSPKNRPSIKIKSNQVSAICKKRKIMSEKNSFVKCSNDSTYTCENCEFIANNQIDLERHVKCHVIRQKCCYCSFITIEKLKMKEHWEVEHQPHEFKFEEAVVTNFLVDFCKSDDGSPRPTITIYHCFYCDTESLKVDELRSHWESFHADSQEKLIFKYRENIEQQFKCAYCGEAGTKAMLANHTWEEHGVDRPMVILKDGEGWICNKCTRSTFLTTKEEIEKHKSLFHSEVHMQIKHVRRIFTCHSCNDFESSSFKSMQNHAETHLKMMKCGQCSEVMENFIALNTHFKLEHPSFKSHIESLSRDETAKEVNKIVAASIKYIDAEYSPHNVHNFCDSNAEPEILISPSYGYSYYGQPVTPVELDKYRTNLVLTGLNMIRVSEVKCDKLAKILDIDLSPTLKLTDCMKVKKDECIGYSYYGQAVEAIDLSDVNTTMTLTGMNKNKVVTLDCAKFSKIFEMDFKPDLKIEDCMKNYQSSRDAENLSNESERMSDKNDSIESNENDLVEDLINENESTNKRKSELVNKNDLLEADEPTKDISSKSTEYLVKEKKNSFDIDSLFNQKKENLNLVTEKEHTREMHSSENAKENTNEVENETREKYHIKTESTMKKKILEMEDLVKCKESSSNINGLLNQSEENLNLITLEENIMEIDGLVNVKENTNELEDDMEQKDPLETEGANDEENINLVRDEKDTMVEKENTNEVADLAREIITIDIEDLIKEKESPLESDSIMKDKASVEIDLAEMKENNFHTEDLTNETYENLNPVEKNETIKTNNLTNDNELKHLSRSKDFLFVEDLTNKNCVNLNSAKENETMETENSINDNESEVSTRPKEFLLVEDLTNKNCENLNPAEDNETIKINNSTNDNESEDLARSKDFLFVEDLTNKNCDNLSSAKENKTMESDNSINDIESEDSTRPKEFLLIEDLTNRNCENLNPAEENETITVDNSTNDNETGDLARPKDFLFVEDLTNKNCEDLNSVKENETMEIDNSINDNESEDSTRPKEFLLIEDLTNRNCENLNPAEENETITVDNSTNDNETGDLARPKDLLFVEDSTNKNCKDLNSAKENETMETDNIINDNESEDLTRPKDFLFVEDLTNENCENLNPTEENETITVDNSTNDNETGDLARPKDLLFVDDSTNKNCEDLNSAKENETMETDNIINDNESEDLTRPKDFLFVEDLTNENCENLNPAKKNETIMETKNSINDNESEDSTPKDFLFIEDLKNKNCESLNLAKENETMETDNSMNNNESEDLTRQNHFLHVEDSTIVIENLPIEGDFIETEENVLHIEDFIRRQENSGQVDGLEKIPSTECTGMDSC